MVYGPIITPYVDSNTGNMGKPMPESTLFPGQGIRILPLWNVRRGFVGKLSCTVFNTLTKLK